MHDDDAIIIFIYECRGDSHNNAILIMFIIRMPSSSPTDWTSFYLRWLVTWWVGLCRSCSACACNRCHLRRTQHVHSWAIALSQREVIDSNVTSKAASTDTLYYDLRMQASKQHVSLPVCGYVRMREGADSTLTCKRPQKAYFFHANNIFSCK